MYSLTGGLFSMPRAVYAMAADGLLFRGLSYVHPRTQTPVISIGIFGSISALLALLVDIEVKAWTNFKIEEKELLCSRMNP